MGADDVTAVMARPIFGLSLMASFLFVCSGGHIFLVLANLTLAGAGLVAIALDGGKQSRPRLYGGENMSKVFAAIPLLNKPLSRLQYPAVMQLIFGAIANVFGKNPYTFRAEEIKVKLEGGSAIKASEDSVWLHWLHVERDLAEEDPIVLLIPGLANTKDSLPDHTLYHHLVKRRWRTVVYEKRGVGHSHGKLQAPVFHLFGHPSDLWAAVKSIQAQYPKAPLHFVSFSAGNGVCGSFLRDYHEKLGPLYRGSLMLNGGENYNIGLNLRDKSAVDKMVSARLLQFVRNYFVRDNEAILKAHNPDAFAALMGTENLQDFYHIAMRGFSGYDDPDEAERLINGFRDGNEWMKSYKGKPSLGVYTADDPIGWQLRPEWIENVEASPNVAGAMFKHGCHCAMYNVEGGRWIDDLILQWVEALERLAK